MSIEKYPDIFNDVFGPVMRPFSSSHTAAPCRIGYVASSLVSMEDIKHITIHMDSKGSFYYSIRMQKLDNAILSGITGHLPDDIIMFAIKDFLKERGITYEILPKEISETDSEAAAKVIITTKEDKIYSVVAKSSGGGVVETEDINGYEYHSLGDSYSILFQDDNKELDAEKISREVNQKYTVIKEGVTENAKGRLLWFQVEEVVDCSDYSSLSTPVYVLKPFQHVLIKKERGPRVFGSFNEWKEIAKKNNTTLDEIVLQYEENSSGWNREQIIAYFKDVIIYNMHRTTHLLYEEKDIEKYFDENVKHAQGYEAMKRYTAEGIHIYGDVTERALRYANAASLGLPEYIFIPGPMGMGGSLIYSSLSAVKEVNHFSEEDLLRGIIVAAGVGLISFINAEPGGTNMGCAGEQGICGAMAAAGIVAMSGGTIEQIENAASFFLQVSVGWPCDPQPGCKGQPCQSRCDTSVIMALSFAQKALLGGEAVFPFDEVLEVAFQVGSETRGEIDCGHGKCPTAIRIRKEFMNGK